MKRFLLLCLLFSLPVHAKTLIEQAYEAGVLDIETSLLYQVQAARDPETLPSEYQEAPARAFCGTPLILQALHARQFLSPDYGRRLAKVLGRPGLAHERVTPSGRFRIHYDLSGQKAVPPDDEDGNGVPDYVDEVARTLDRIWGLEVDTLGFDPPPTDRGLGGGLEYDVYIVDLGRGGAYGFTYPEMGGLTSYSYLELDNDYTDPIYQQTRGLDALHVTVAHEFNHAIQFGYYQGSDGIWWQEATSTWMEEVAYPKVDDYLQYIPSFLLSPEKALDSGSRLSSDFRMYGASIFAHFLDQRYKRSLIRAIWEELGRRANARPENFDRVLRQVAKSGLGEAVSEFAIWNFFTGERHRKGYYHEGEKYPETRLRDVHIDPNSPKVPVEHKDQVDHLASTYVHLEPQLHSGGIMLDFHPERGSWTRQLILAAPDSVEIRSVEKTPVSVSGWNRYEDVVLVLTVTEHSGFAYEYSLSVEYDPDLIGAEPPPAFVLKQNSPNPFRTSRHEHTRFVFDLDRASSAARLSIFTTAGRLVWSRDLGWQAPGMDIEDADAIWDGRNQAGERVDSGIYYYVLEVDGARATKTLAVVREEDE